MAAPDEKARLEDLEQQFPMLEASDIVYNFPDDLAALNEVNVYVHIFDFTDGEEKNVWGNKALCSLMGVNLEVLQSINLTDCSETLRAWQKSLLKNIQMDKKTETSMKTISPGGKPISLFYTFRPMRLLFPGAQEPRTVVFSTSLPVNNESKEEKELILCQEMTRYTHVAQMVVSKATHKVVYSNQSARLFWPDLADRTKEVAAHDIVEGRMWQSEEEKKDVLERYHGLTIRSSPFEVECRVKDTLVDQNTWHCMTFTPCIDPMTGGEAVTINEYDTTKLHLQAEMLEESRAREEEFLAAVSHELRTPLNGIIGLSESLQQNSKCDQQMIKTLQLIKTCGKRLAALVNDILDSASSRRGTFTLKDESVSLREVCEGVCETLTPLCGAAVKIVNEVDKDGKLPHVEGDGGRITQIVTNFISNSIKFTERGSITVSSLLLSEAEIKISITDTGCGIPNDKLTKIWEPFKQVDMSTTRKYGGTGLGLSLVKQLVEAHGGRVGVTSRYGVDKPGSTFFFVLPIKRSARKHVDEFEEEERQQAAMPEETARAAEERRVESAKEEAAREQMQRREGQEDDEQLTSLDVQHHSQLFGEFEILSVDDNQLNHVVVENSLVPKGYKVTKCMSGTEALRLLETRGYLPDLILLDCMMPEMDGNEMCEQLRLLYPCSTLPVIMVSAKNQEADIVRGLKAGCNDFISKPYGCNELNARIDVQFKIRYLWNLEIQRLLSDRQAVLHLPAEVEERVQSGALSVHRNVLVAAIDIQDLLAYCRTLRANELAVLVNEVYDCLDDVAQREQLTRIIDDCYIVVVEDDAKGEAHRLKRVVEVASEMLSKADQVRVKLKRGVEVPKVRVGLARGMAHSALVGMKFASYSYFGPVVRDAIEIASRGHAGCIVASADLTETLGEAARDQWVPLEVRGGDSQRLCMAKRGPYQDALWKEAEGGGRSPDEEATAGAQDTRHLRTLVRVLSAAGQPFAQPKKRRSIDQISVASVASSEEGVECPRCEDWRQQLEASEVDWQHKLETVEHELGKARQELKKLRGSSLMSEITRTPSNNNSATPNSSYNTPLSEAIYRQSPDDRQAVIMSVDDDPVNQMVVENLLDPIGYKVVTCMNGMEALEALNSTSRLPDLILLDNMMPVMNGLECCGRIREKYPRNILPIIMVSAKTKVDSIVEGLEQGCNDYVSKPFDRIELLARISTQLRARDAHYAELENSRSSQLLARLIPEHALSKLRANPSGAMLLEDHPHVAVLVAALHDFPLLSAAADSFELLAALGELAESMEALCRTHDCFLIDGGRHPFVVVAGLQPTEACPAQTLIALATEALDAAREVRDPRDRSQHLRLRMGMQVGAASEGVVGVQFGFFGAAVSRAQELAGAAHPMNLLLSDEVMSKLAGNRKAPVTKQVGAERAHLVCNERCCWREAMHELDQAQAQAAGGQGGEGLSAVVEELEGRVAEEERLKGLALRDLAAANDKLRAAMGEATTLRASARQHLPPPPVIPDAERTAAKKEEAAGPCKRCGELELRLQDSEDALEASRAQNNQLITTCSRLSDAISSPAPAHPSPPPHPSPDYGRPDDRYDPYSPMAAGGYDPRDAFGAPGWRGARGHYPEETGRGGDGVSSMLAEVMLLQAQKEMLSAQTQMAMLYCTPQLPQPDLRLARPAAHPRTRDEREGYGGSAPRSAGGGAWQSPNRQGSFGWRAGTATGDAAEALALASQQLPHNASSPADRGGPQSGSAGGDARRRRP